ncbi:MAG: DUF202 domain-containing protein [Oligoflexia bacterium]|nr:DUF202 domain-containing protein [Oligoflexia bacterium]
MSFNQKPYSKFVGDQLILRDWLAIDRTILANKRTLLAYIRTSMAFFISGITAVHFVETSWIKILGIIFVAISIIIFVFGFYEFYKYRNVIQILLKNNAFITKTATMESE